MRVVPQRTPLLRRLLPCSLLVAATCIWFTRPLWTHPDGRSLATLPAINPVKHPEGRAAVLFVGDTHFGESYTAEGIQPDPLVPQGYQSPLVGVRALAATADLTIANLETPLTARRSPWLRIVKRWVHWGNPEPTTQALLSLGVRAVSLANNHAFDALQGGLEDTQSALASHGIVGFGAGSALATAARAFRADFDFAPGKLSLLVLGALERSFSDCFQGAYASACGSGAFPLIPGTLAAEIRALRQMNPAQFVVVFPHWGDNYTWRSDRQMRIAHDLIDAGADLVIGHGAHLFQEIEAYHDKLIIYNLGNFVFLSPGRYQTAGMHPHSLAVRLDFTEASPGPVAVAHLYFLASDNRATGYRPHVLAGEEFELAMKTLLDGGQLSPTERQVTKLLVQRTRDGVGERLSIALGPLNAPPSRLPPTNE